MLHLLCHSSRLEDCLNAYQLGDQILLLDQATLLAHEKHPITFFIRESDLKQLGLTQHHANVISDSQWVLMCEQQDKNRTWKAN